MVDTKKDWIKLHRNLLVNVLWRSEPFSKGQAWVDLLLLANHMDGYFFNRGIRVDVQRGQVGMSELQLSIRWKWSRTKVKSFFALLEKEQQIVQHRNNVNTLITIVNYDLYQEKEQEKEHQENNRSATEVQQRNNRKAAEVQQESTNKNDKNKPKDILSEFEVERLAFFEELWKAYPADGRVKKKESLRHYNTTVKTDTDMDRINEALGHYLNHLKDNTWKKPQNGSTWFNNWQDWEAKDDAA